MLTKAVLQESNKYLSMTTGQQIMACEISRIGKE